MYAIVLGFCAALRAFSERRPGAGLGGEPSVSSRDCKSTVNFPARPPASSRAWRSPSRTSRAVGDRAPLRGRLEYTTSRPPLTAPPPPEPPPHAIPVADAAMKMHKAASGLAAPGTEARMIAAAL